MPLLTIVAHVETDSCTKKLVKGTMWYATKVYNGLIWHIRERLSAASRKDLNRVIKLLPARQAYYSHSVQATRDEVIQAHKSFIALKAKGRTSITYPAFVLKILIHRFAIMLVMAVGL